MGNGGDIRFPTNVVNINGGLGANLTTSNPNTAGGLNVNRNTWGNWGNANAASFIANDPGAPGGWSGFGTPPGLAVYPGIDNGAIYSEITGPAPTAVVANVTFDATHLYMPVGSPLSPAVLAILQPGMFIETSHSPTFKGQITAIDPAGASLTISNGWFQFGNQALGQNPQTVGTGPYSANINIVTGIWAQNSQVFLNATSYAKNAMGYEIDISSATGSAMVASSTFGALSDVPSVNGFYATCGGATGCSNAFAMKGTFLRAFVALGGSQVGFLYSPATAGGIGFLSQQTAGSVLSHYMPANGGAIDVNLLTGGQLVLGSTAGAATVPYIDFHSSGNTGRDVRFWPTGGSGASDGNFQLQAANFDNTGTFQMEGALATFGSTTNASVFTEKFHSMGAAAPDAIVYILGGTAGTQGLAEYRIVANTTSFADPTNTGGFQIVPNVAGGGTLRNFAGTGAGNIVISTAGTGLIYFANAAGNQDVLGTATFDIGNQGVAASQIIGFHSSGSTARDAYIVSLGGTSGSVGLAELRHVAATASFFDATNTGGLQIIPSAAGGATIRATLGIISLQAGGSAITYLGTATSPVVAQGLFAENQTEALVSAGTNQATAAALTLQNNTAGTCATGGFILPAPQSGTIIRFYNRSGATCTVYPNGGSQIESAGTNIPITVASGLDMQFIRMTSTQWRD